MNKSDFLREQFLALRKEISEAQTRMYRIILYGIIFLPAAHFLGKSYNIDVIMVSLPIIVIIVSLLYLSQTRAIMRCGRYIRLHIEPHVSDVEGWEKWLEDRRNICHPRLVDRFVNYCLYLLYFIYYISSVLLAFRFANEKYGVVIGAFLLGVYIVAGIGFIIFFARNVEFSTVTRYD